MSDALLQETHDAAHETLQRVRRIQQTLELAQGRFQTELIQVVGLFVTKHGHALSCGVRLVNPPQPCDCGYGDALKLVERTAELGPVE